MAEKRGRSGLVGFFVGFFLGFFGIIAYAVIGKTDEKKIADEKAMEKARLEAREEIRNNG